jgi:hypothetical protein
MNRKHQAWLCVLAVGSSVACDWDLNRKQETPPRIDPGAGPGTANSPMPLATTSPAEDNARPSTNQNMGRDFQGALELEVRTTAGKQHRIRYLSRGNDARLQLDDVGGGSSFDALVWGENLSIIDNRAKTYRTVALDGAKKLEGDEKEVRVDTTGERSLIDGVGCERYEIVDGPVRVSAWVTALSGTFATDVLEAASGIDVPSWAELLLDQQRLPLRATAKDASGRELYTLNLVRYTAGPVADSEVALPSNYQPAAGQAVR